MDFDVSAVTVDEAALAEFDQDYRVDHNHWSESNKWCYFQASMLWFKIGIIARLSSSN
jgi:hypothetical protein